MRILAVDDHPEILNRLEIALAQEGHEVATCETGEGALGRCRQGSYDLILLDIGLPGIDGFEVVEQLRQEGIQTPVIMLTAQSSEEDTNRVFQNRFLSQTSFPAWP